MAGPPLSFRDTPPCGTPQGNKTATGAFYRGDPRDYTDGLIMPLRLFLILALLVQQLALPAAVSAASQAGVCVDASCCQVVEMKSCCGETIREMRCGKTGGQCLCAVEPGNSEPVPNAPRPTDWNEIAPVLVGLRASVIDGLEPARLHALPAAPAIVRTHNETQALLCIWRT